MKVGVRNEDKSRWERRVPLVPADLIALRDAGIDAAVQTSPYRAFGEMNSLGPVCLSSLT
jgi:alanine dehydrogenase